MQGKKNVIEDVYCKIKSELEYEKKQVHTPLEEEFVEKGLLWIKETEQMIQKMKDLKKEQGNNNEGEERKDILSLPNDVLK